MKLLQAVTKRILFIKINLSFIIVGFILIFTFSVFIYHHTYLNTVDKVKSWNQTVQKQAVGASDEIISSLEIYMNYLLKNDAIINLGLEEKAADRLMTYAINERIYAVKINNPVIRSIYLYNDKMNKVISTEDIPQSSHDFYDQEALEALNARRLGDQRYLIRKPKLEINGNIWNERLITIAYPLYPGDETDRSGLIVNIDVEIYSNIVLNPEIVQDRMAMVFNKEGDVLIDFSEYDEDHHVIIDKILSSGNEQGSFDIKLDGKNTLVVYEFQKQTGMFYTFLNDYDGMAGEARNQFSIFYTVIGILLVLLLLLSLGFSFINYEPYRKLLNKVGLVGWQAGMDDLKYLNQSINDLFKQARNHGISEKNKYLLKICYGELDDLSLQFQNVTIEADFPYENFRVMRVELDKYHDVLRKEGITGVNLLHYVTKNIAEEIFQNAGKLHIFSLNEQSEVAIFNFTKENKQELTVKLLQTRKIMRDKFKVDISFYVGKSVKKNGIADSYAEAEDLYRHRLLQEKRGVYYWLEAKKDENYMYSYPQEIEAQLISNLKLQKLDGIQHDLKRFLQHIRCFTDSEVQTAIIQLLSRVNSVMLQLMDASWKLENMEYRQLCEKISDLMGMDEIEGWLFGIFEMVMEELKTRQSSRAGDVIDSIKSFIDKNYRSASLAIDDIALEMKLSNNYVRNLFKKQEGIGIGEYVQDKRLNEVCRLLTETDWTIKKICEETGFSNVNYFHTAFKKRFGMTPNAFRKSKT